MEIRGTHHMALVTSNFASMRTFYTQTLGLPVVGAFEGHNIIFLQAGDITIELIERANADRIVGNWEHFCFEVPDVDAAYAELTALGVVFHIEPRDFPTPPEVRLAFFRDPDGNNIEILHSLTGSRYPQRGL